MGKPRDELKENNVKYSGIIRTFIPRRQFGFILRDDGKDFFFHLAEFHGTPTLGQRVEFELGPAVKLGMPDQAVEVTPVTGGAQ